ncbi:MAG: hypothetical protein R3E66_18380 [bacterium]
MNRILFATLCLGLAACGDDVKKSVNTPSNNTTANNTTSNNTTANNTTANNINTANNVNTGNNANNVSGSLELGTDTDAISTLTAANICAQTAAFFSANLSEQETAQIGCFLSGAFTAAFGEPATDAEAQMLCQDSYDECIANPEPTNNTNNDCTFDVTNCDATIGELEGCIEEQTATLKALASASCSDLTVNSEPPGLDDPTICQDLEAACPNLFGNDQPM